MSFTALTFYIIALLMFLFGYQRERWWIPAVAGGVFTGFLWFWYVTAHGRTDGGVLFNVLVFSLPLNLFVFYAAYGIGRGLARWRKEGRP